MWPSYVASSQRIIVRYTFTAVAISIFVSITAGEFHVAKGSIHIYGNRYIYIYFDSSKVKYM
jgi:hypothetical protein